MSAQPAVNRDAFAEARESFGAIETFLGSKEACSLRESDLERELEKRGRELMRQLLEAHIQVRGPGEAAAPVKGTEGEERVQQRLHERGLETVFGEVRIERAGYVAKGMESLHPMDADLNLPKELYSHEVRRRVGWTAAGNSFDEVIGMLSETTGAHVGKRQVEELVIRAAEDFDAFYKEGYAFRPWEQTGPIMVVTVDGKGVVMRHEDLREATQKKAETTRHKLTNRLSRGEKRNSKRMATVAAVYRSNPIAGRRGMLWAVWRHSTSGKDRVGRGRKTNGFGPVWKRRPRKSSKKPFAKRECGIRKDIRDGWRWSMATKRNWRSSASASTKKATIRGLFSTSSMWPSGCGRPVWISIKKEPRNWKPGFPNGCSLFSTGGPRMWPPVCAAAPHFIDSTSRRDSESTPVRITCSNTRRTCSTTSI